MEFGGACMTMEDDVFFCERLFADSFNGVLEEVIGERIRKGELAFGFADPFRLEGQGEIASGFSTHKEFLHECWREGE